MHDGLNHVARDVRSIERAVDPHQVLARGVAAELDRPSLRSAAPAPGRCGSFAAPGDFYCERTREITSVDLIAQL